MSFDQIDKVWFSTREEDIEDFLANFSRECRAEEFCSVYMSGGDQTGTRFERLAERRWLLNNVDELIIENIIAYRDPSRSYRGFFIVIAAPDEPFQWLDTVGVPIARPRPDPESSDYATLFEGAYMDSAIQGRSYFKRSGKSMEVTADKFCLRKRHMKRTAYLIVPNGSAASCMIERSPMIRLLEGVAESRRLDDQALSDYLNATQAHHSYELAKWD